MFQLVIYKVKRCITSIYKSFSIISREILVGQLDQNNVRSNQIKTQSIKSSSDENQDILTLCPHQHDFNQTGNSCVILTCPARRRCTAGPRTIPWKPASPDGNHDTSLHYQRCLIHTFSYIVYSFLIYDHLIEFIKEYQKNIN